MTQLKDISIDWFNYFDITPDLVCIADKDGFFKKVNHAVIRKLGYTEEELFAAPISSFIHPDDKPQTHDRRTKLLGGEALVDFENRYVTKSGETVWLHWTSIYLADKEIVFAIARDITDKKIIEKEVADKYKKFEGLATHFKTNIEKERKNYAYELQEQLAQLAAVIKIDVESVAVNSPELTEASRYRIQHALAASGVLIKTIQRISSSLSPKMLEDFGLNATLEWLCKEFTILNNIPCSFDNDYEVEDLSEEMKIDFFRISQESLANVISHADASHVSIRIERSDDSIQLTITDDGKGFDPAVHKPGTGLINMHKLAASINGVLIVESEPGKGTKVKLTVKS
jgi:PAS domain S-box-containing protein